LLIGANVIITSRAPAPALESLFEVITGIDVQNNECGKQLAAALNNKKIDILINNAGYFYEPVEKIDSLNFEEEMKMIKTIAVKPQ
jgi:short-subunit dehydrogenase